MAKKYGSKASPRRGNSIPQQALVMLVTFVLGYFSASIFDIDTLSHWMTSQILDNTANKTPVAVSAQREEHVPPKPKFEFYTLLANEKGVTASQVAIARNAAAVARAASATAPAVVAAKTAPSGQKTSASNPVLVAAATTTSPRMAAAKPASINQPPSKPAVIASRPVAPTNTSINHFVVQVASFKARNDAEHMKGLLALKGFEVSVVPVSTPAQGNWFRVVIGPYPNRGLAQKAQAILARNERLNGMVRNADG